MVTHPAYASLDHPSLRLWRKRVVVFFNNELLPSFPLAEEGVAQRSVGGVSKRHAYTNKKNHYISSVFITIMQSITEFCRELRQRETEAERILWDYLRNRKLSKHKFLRQYPVSVSAYGFNRYYIPDFYCHKAKLVIEADGPIHLLKQEYDKNRDEVLKTLGLSILRFKNDQIINDTEAVLKLIERELDCK